MCLLDLLVLHLDDSAQAHCLLLEPLERFLQRVHSCVDLQFELLLRSVLLDEQKLLLDSYHVALKLFLDENNSVTL